MSNRIYLFFQFLKTKVSNLNLFKSQATNVHVIRKQRLTTRLYLLTFVVVLVTLILYTSLKKSLVNVKVNILNQNQYEQLQMNYPNTMNCPCNRISIEYKYFIELHPFYHQICTSTFVNEEWIFYLGEDYQNIDIHEPIFRRAAVGHFRVLSTLCQLAEETVNNSLTQFYSTIFISDQLISSQLFQIQAKSIIDLFQDSMPRTFKRTLNTFRGIIHGNALLSDYETNWKFTILSTQKGRPIYTNPRSYGRSCTCGTSLKCSQAVIVDEHINTSLTGLFIGCYPLEGVLQSSLECLYDETCCNIIISIFQENTPEITFTILNSSLSSTYSYQINETVQQIVDRLFVNDWNVNYSYQNYFQQCNPSYCTYSYIQNFDILYIVTVILGLYGGLTISLKIIVPFVINISLWVLKHRKNHVVPLT